MPYVRNCSGPTTSTSTPRARTRSTASATNRPAESPGKRGYDVVSTPTRINRSSTQRPRGDDRKRQREHCKCVEVIELHRQVEEVRGHRACERGRHSPRQRPHTRGDRKAVGRQPPPECASSVQAREEVAQEEQKRDRADETGLDDQRHVEGVRTPVRFSRDELVVDGEGVQA